MRAANDTATPMPIFSGSSSRGVTIGLVALLECSVGEVVEFAPTGKYVEGAGVTDMLVTSTSGMPDVLVTSTSGMPDVLVTSTSGVGKISSPTPTQVENPKRSTNFEAAYTGNSELGTVVGLVIV